MNTPHKHKDLIIAWANGAQIEYNDPISDLWCPIDKPSWDINKNYRMRLEPKYEYEWAISIGFWPDDVSPNENRTQCRNAFRIDHTKREIT